MAPMTDSELELANAQAVQDYKVYSVELLAHGQCALLHCIVQHLAEHSLAFYHSCLGWHNVMTMLHFTTHLFIEPVSDIVVGCKFGVSTMSTRCS